MIESTKSKQERFFDWFRTATGGQSLDDHWASEKLACSWSLHILRTLLQWYNLINNNNSVEKSKNPAASRSHVLTYNSLNLYIATGPLHSIEDFRLTVCSCSPIGERSLSLKPFSGQNSQMKKRLSLHFIACERGEWERMAYQAFVCFRLLCDSILRVALACQCHPCLAVSAGASR